MANSESVQITSFDRRSNPMPDEPSLRACHRRHLIAGLAGFAAVALFGGCAAAPGNSGRCVAVARAGRQGRQMVGRPCPHG